VGHVEIGDSIAPQHFSTFRTIEKDEGRKQRQVGTFVEDQIRLHSAVTYKRVGRRKQSIKDTHDFLPPSGFIIADSGALIESCFKFPAVAPQ
jgi:hypothetical protein